MASDRDRLVEEHLDLVHAIASKLKRKLGKTMDEGDLVGYGTQGLIEAAKKFDPGHGTPFAAFAYYRIRGAMFDGMRTMGWYSRSDCARFRAEERASEYLSAAGEREAAEKVASASAASKDKAELLQDIADLLSGVATVHITCLESARELPDDRFKAPDDELFESEERWRVREAVATLPDKERQLMELYYFADLNLEAAGAKLGLSKSWASRLHTRAVHHLREALGEPDHGTG
jgi:RNA polymerase sigma factor for flagellar operon FliA